MKLIQKQIHPNLNKALDKMLLLNTQELKFYYFFLSYIDFWEAELPMPTMCVGVVGMKLSLMYDRVYVESRTTDDLMAILVHEVFHLVHSHLERGKTYNPQASNIAMDMVINDIITRHHKDSITLPVIRKEDVDRYSEEAEKFIKESNPPADLVKAIHERLGVIASKVGQNECVMLDQNYNGELVFEPLYQWLMEQNKQRQQGNPHSLSKDTENILDNCGSGMTFDYHGSYDELTEELKQQMGEEIFQKAKMQMRGFVPGNVEEAFKFMLQKPKNNNLRILKRVISSIKGFDKQKSYRRLNRRITGVKGKIKQSLEFNCLLDVSGSMYGQFEVALNEIFRDNYSINLIECDTKISRTQKIRKKDELKNLIISGLGGTELQPGIEYVLNPKNKIKDKPTIILTDGYTDTFDFHNSPNQFLILTVAEPCGFVNGPNVKQIQIKQ